MKQVLTIFCLCCIFCIYSEEKNLLSVTSGETTGKIADCVDVISGTFYISKTDAHVVGAEPLFFQHMYMSRYVDSPMSGWYFFNHLQVLYHTCTGLIHVRDPDGSPFLYREIPRKYKRKKKKPFFESEKAKEKRKERNRRAQEHNAQPRETELLKGRNLAGFTNTSKQEMSGKTNIKNSKVTLSADYKYLYVQVPDGSERIYERQEAEITIRSMEDYLNLYHVFRLIEERFPNRRKFIYCYDHRGLLREIHSCNLDQSKSYAWIKFHYLRKPEDAPDADVETSDQTLLKYRFARDRKSRPFILQNVTKSDHPDEHYLYDSDRYLFARKRAEGRSLYVEYYQIGDNDVNGQRIHISDMKDPRYRRVRSLKAPVGKDGALETVFTFIYEVGEVGKTGGKTYVYDAHKNLSIYSYSPYLRLEKVQRYEGDKVVQSEQFVWGKENTPLESNLLVHSLYDANQTCVRATHYLYDDFSNVIEERSFGSLSKEPPSISFDENQLPILGSSACILRRSYSQDGKNLLLKEEEENGKSTEYQYDPTTDQITAKWIKDQNEIKIRHFYEYDSDCFLIREISDDGNSQDPNDLSSVSRRWIKQIHRIEEGPFVKMEKSIEKKYLDLSTNQERLFQKVVFHYSSLGKVVQEDYFDANQSFIYSLHYEYDGRKRLISKTDPLGQKTHYRYDANHNCIEKKEASKTCIKVYDCVDRVIQEKQISKEGIENNHFFTYDAKGQLIQEKNDLGHETHFTYDSLGNQTSIQLPSILDEQGIRQTPTLFFKYDSLGNRISQIDAKNNETAFLYNSYHQLCQTTYPDGSTEICTYNIDKTLQSKEDPKGVLTTYSYDFLKRNTSVKIFSKGRDLLCETSKTYGSFNLQSETDPEGFTTLYEYNHLGQKIFEKKEKETKEFIYDFLGREHKVICEDVVQVKEYDLLNRCTVEAMETLEGTLQYKKEKKYDEMGNLCEITEYKNNQPTTQTFFYDGLKRLIKEVNPFQGVTTYEYKKIKNPLEQNVLEIQKKPL